MKKSLVLLPLICSIAFLSSCSNKWTMRISFDSYGDEVSYQDYAKKYNERFDLTYGKYFDLEDRIDGYTLDGEPIVTKRIFLNDNSLFFTYRSGSIRYLTGFDKHIYKYVECHYDAKSRRGTVDYETRIVFDGDEAHFANAKKHIVNHKSDGKNTFVRKEQFYFEASSTNPKDYFSPTTIVDLNKKTYQEGSNINKIMSLVIIEQISKKTETIKSTSQNTKYYLKNNCLTYVYQSEISEKDQELQIYQVKLDDGIYIKHHNSFSLARSIREQSIEPKEIKIEKFDYSKYTLVESVTYDEIMDDPDFKV